MAQHVFDVVRSDGLQVLVSRALGNDDDAFPLSELAVLAEDVAHFCLPVVHLGRSLGNKNMVCTRAAQKPSQVSVYVGGKSLNERKALRYGSHDSEPATVPAHDLDNKGARVGGGSGRDAVHGFANAMESSRGSYGQIRAC